MPDNRSAPRQLADAAARRTLQAEQRVQGALRGLDREGAAVTFAAVAKRAGVSRVFLDEHAELRAAIEALRSAQAAAPARLPVRQRASDTSLRARLRAALDENHRQREEIARLREELAHRSQQAPQLPLPELRRVAAKRVEHAWSDQAGERPKQCRGERDSRQDGQMTQLRRVLMDTIAAPGSVSFAGHLDGFSAQRTRGHLAERGHAVRPPPVEPSRRR